MIITEDMRKALQESLNDKWKVQTSEKPSAPKKNHKNRKGKSRKEKKPSE